MHFSHKAQSAYSMLVPRSLDTFQCRIYSAQFPLPGEHAVPSITACEMALANSHILPGPHLYTWVESSNVDKFVGGHTNRRISQNGPCTQCTGGTDSSVRVTVDESPCWWTKVHGNGEIRTWTLSARVEWILQYTATPPVEPRYIVGPIQTYLLYRVSWYVRAKNKKKKENGTNIITSLYWVCCDNRACYN